VLELQQLHDMAMQAEDPLHVVHVPLVERQAVREVHDRLVFCGVSDVDAHRLILAAPPDLSDPARAPEETAQGSGVARRW
jgi:hypothetical protein